MIEGEELKNKDALKNTEALDFPANIEQFKIWELTSVWE